MVWSFLRTWWWKLLVVMGAGFLLIQLIPYGVDNPSTNDEPQWDSAQTRELFMRACADCHSNNTNVLWFEHVAPVKWYITNHVREGRAGLNVSEWNTAPGHGVDEMAEEIEEGAMPPSYYTYFGLHSEAKLTDSEKRQLIDGLEATLAADPPAGDGD